MVSLSPAMRPAAGEPAFHFAVGKAQPAMGIILAQEFQVMRREIGDQQPPARRHHAGGFRDGGPRIVQIMQHLMKQHGIEHIRLARERQAIGVGQPHLRMVEIVAQQPVARDRQHFRADIHAHGALRMGRQQFQHAAGAGAGIQQIVDRSRGHAA